MNPDFLLDTFGGIDDRFILEAQGFGSARRRGTHRKALLYTFAAVLLLLLSLLTAMALSEDVREAVFDFFKPEGTFNVDEINSTISPEAEDSTERPSGHVAELGGLVTAEHYLIEGYYFIGDGTVSFHESGQWDVTGVYAPEYGALTELTDWQDVNLSVTLFGQEIPIAFSWSRHNGNLSFKTGELYAPWSISRIPGRTDAVLLMVYITADTGGAPVSTNCPLLLELDTLAVTDVLAESDAGLIHDIENACFTPDLSRALIVTCGNTEYYLCDRMAGTCTPLADIAGQAFDRCCFLGDDAVCFWRLSEDFYYDCWNVSLTDGSKTAIFERMPLFRHPTYSENVEGYMSPEASRDCALSGQTYGGIGYDTGVQFLPMFSTAHDGSALVPCGYCLYVDEAREVSAIDLLTGGRIRIDGFVYPTDPTEVIKSPAGDKALIVSREAGRVYTYIGVLDFEAGYCTALDREGALNNEHAIGWFTDGSLYISTSNEDDPYTGETSDQSFLYIYTFHEP